ncbi:class I SAM-dependent methyltransferase [Candidatus Sumerlaeota bacterium]|nr:class I SAM-dependent methyltransferase [Candidatus Sumerlaeota bacterium]
MNVFEYGSGGSTIYFAKRAGTVTSTEENPQWINRVQAKLDELGLDNANVQHRLFNFSEVVDFGKSEYLHSIPNSSMDIIVVDGTQWVTPVRPTCFQHAQKNIKPGGIIILDDSWLHPDIRENNKAKSHREFKSVGPCRSGVTSTDIFFY